MKHIEAAKEAAGATAAQFVKPGMVVGLGTGSTAYYFIKHLIVRRQKEDLPIHAVASSEASLKQAQEGGIPLAHMDQITSIDLTVDGADEIDASKQMIKGGGGALVREKIVANMSRELVIIIDETKLVSRLGARPLPVEIIPFASHATKHLIEKTGYSGAWRRTKNGSLYITHNGNYILDIHFPALRENPRLDHEAIRRIPGVVDTGFFFDLAGRVVVGFLDGQVAIK